MIMCQCNLFMEKRATNDEALELYFHMMYIDFTLT